MSSKEKNDEPTRSNDTDQVDTSDIIHFLEKLTIDSQASLAQKLHNEFQLIGRTFRCYIVDYDELGILVDVIIEAKDFYGSWTINNVHIFWSDLPSKLSDLPSEKLIELAKIKLPLDTLVYVTVIALDNLEGLRIVFAKYPNPIFAPLEIQPYKRKSKFRYLIIVDFESTCDYSPFPVVDCRTAEIIEFPWITLDTETCKVIYENRLYVNPDNKDGITKFCTKLTNITKEMASKGSNLEKSIEIFDDYIKNEILTKEENTFCILTDGIWDLRIQLCSEAERKGIKLNPWFKKFLDLKTQYLNTIQFFEDYKPSLFQMLKSFNLSIIGNHHSGLDDCRSITQVVIKLLHLGCDFSDVEHIPENVDPFSDPRFVDFGSVAEPDAWYCSNDSCHIYNRPWMQTCRFCKNKKKDDNKNSS